MTAAPTTARLDSAFLVPFEGDFDLAARATAPPAGTPGRKALRKERQKRTEALGLLQRRLFAHHRHSVLLVFQAMDAAGKDGTIRAVMSGVDPSGCSVHSFGPPSAEERAHDFLWRTTVRMPLKGRIGIFNRSYYEEVLIVRVLPSLLEGQELPRELPLEQRFAERYESIRDFEKHMARNGTTVIKFFLNVGQDEQRRRLLKRLDDPARNWKFNAADLDARAKWPQYMAAYRDALAETSRPWAPWYCIPADDKRYMRLQVADIVVKTIEALDPTWPEMPPEDRARLSDFRAALGGGDPTAS
jgi:PPK2 family polyphosphate:nucleotide phosphotransferase